MALLIWNPRWLWLVWAGLLGAEVFVRGLPTSWLVALLSSAVLTLGYAAIARAAADRLGSPAKLATRRDFVMLLLIVIAGTLMNALLYVGALAVGGTGPQGSFAAAAARFWIGDAVGLLVTLPLLLVFGDRARRAESMAMLQTFEYWAVAIVIALATWVVFGSGMQDHFKLFYLLFVPVVWAAARFGVTGTTWAAALTQILVIVAVQSLEHQALTVFELQSLMAALAATGLLLGTTVDERERAANELRGSLRMAAAGDMVAAMAHELSQPLTALNSYARACQLLAVELDRDPSAQRAPLVDVTHKLVDEAQRGTEVVKRLRDLTERERRPRPWAIARFRTQYRFGRLSATLNCCHDEQADDADDPKSPRVAAKHRSVCDVKRRVKGATSNECNSQRVDVAAWRVRELCDHDAGNDRRHSLERVKVRQVGAAMPTRQTLAVTSGVLHVLGAQGLRARGYREDVWSKNRQQDAPKRYGHFSPPISSETRSRIFRAVTRGQARIKRRTTLSIIRPLAGPHRPQYRNHEGTGFACR